MPERQKNMCGGGLWQTTIALHSVRSMYKPIEDRNVLKLWYKCYMAGYVATNSVMSLA